MSSPIAGLPNHSSTTRERSSDIEPSFLIVTSPSATLSSTRRRSTLRCEICASREAMTRLMLANARESAPTSSLVSSRISTTSPSSKRLAALASCARRLTTSNRLSATTTAASPSAVAEKVSNVLRCAAKIVAFS